MAFNSILIKRRLTGSAGAPASLSGGELAFNEVDSTLYYGASGGVILPIGGSGSFVDRTSNQTVSGDKTFVGSTTLGTTTFSNGSTLDFGGNTLTNLGAPSLSTDATTKQYVDDEIASLAGSGGTAVTNLSVEIYNNFVEKVESEFVDLNGGLDVSSGLTADELTVTTSATVSGNLTVGGDLIVLGTTTTINTDVTTTSAFEITNNGSETALTVTQLDGTNNVAEFKDGADTAMVITGTGTGGQVAIGTSTPATGVRLTVNGSISAADTIYAAGGMEILGGAGTTTFYVENGKVGINTETPNEELTVIGSISATEDLSVQDIFARNGDFTGTLAVDGAVTIDDTLSATGAVEFDSTLTVDGAVTLNSTLDVTSAATFTSSVSAQGALTIEGSSTLNGSVTIDNTLDVNSTFTVDGLVTINNDTTTTGSISGTAGTSYLVDFVIDGGTF